VEELMYVFYLPIKQIVSLGSSIKFLRL